MRANYRLSVIFLFLIITTIFSSCKENPTPSTRENTNNKEYQLKLNRYSNHSLRFFEVDIKHLDSSVINPESMEMVNYRTIVDISDDDINFISQNIIKNKLIIGAVEYEYKYPNNSINEITTHRINYPVNSSLQFTGIVKLKYEYPDSSEVKTKYSRIIGYSNYPTNEDFDWELFFNNKKNIFNIYTNINEDWE